MIVKKSDELFVFSDGSTQKYPNRTNDDSASVVKKSDYVEPVIDTLAQTEYNWAKSELESSDIEIKYHERNSKRAKLTVEQWYEYQEQLRDYATVKDGAYSTEGDRPTRPE